MKSTKSNMTTINTAIMRMDADEFCDIDAASVYRMQTCRNMLHYFGSQLDSFHFARMAELMVKKYQEWGYDNLHEMPLPLVIAKHFIIQDAYREGRIIKIGQGLYRIA